MTASVRLGDVADIVAGGREKWTGRDFVEAGYPAFGAGGVNGYLPNFEFDRPAVVLSSIGARCGKCFLAEGKWSSLANTQLILPKLDRADAKYLWYQLNDEGRWHRSGTAQPFIKPSDVKNHLIHLPPLDEQRRIAAILDTADALRSKRREALAKLDDLTASIFFDMFGDPASNPRQLPTKSIGELTQVGTGSTPSRERNDYFGGGIPWVKTTEVNGTVICSTEESITASALAETSCHLYPVGSIVIALYGQGRTRGQCAVLGIEAATNQACAVLPPSDAYDTTFMFHQLKLCYSRLRDRGRGGNQENLNLGLIRDFEVLGAPLPEQRRFADTANAAGAAAASALGSLRRLDALFGSLRQRAFRGEL